MAVSNAVKTGPQCIKMDFDRAPSTSNVEHHKTPEIPKESGRQEDAKGDDNVYDERQPKRRKRNIMNGEQISEIEKALVDEPEMHKNMTLLQAWSEKFSLQGSEITASQLKNWLNNRKAKLARMAKKEGCHMTARMLISHLHRLLLILISQNRCPRQQKIRRLLKSNSKRRNNQCMKARLVAHKRPRGTRAQGGLPWRT